MRLSSAVPSEVAPGGSVPGAFTFFTATFLRPRYSRAFLHALVRSETVAMHLLTVHNIAYQVGPPGTTRRSAAL